jgi:hypothetical protein
LLTEAGAERLLRRWREQPPAGLSRPILAGIDLAIAVTSLAGRE